MEPLPPSPTTPASLPASTAGRPAVLIVVDDPPAGLPPRGSRFQGRIEGVRPDGGVDLRTPFGVLKAHASQPMLLRAGLVLSVQSTVPGTVLKVVAATPPLPLAGPPASGATDAKTMPLPGGGAGREATSPLAPGALVKAIALAGLATAPHPTAAAALQRPDGPYVAGGGPVMLRLVGPGREAGLMAANPAAATGSAHTAGPFSATVADVLGPRQVILASAGGRWLVETPVPLPPGWTATWELRPLAPVQAAATAASSISGVASAWAEFSAAWHALLAAAPGSGSGTPLTAVVPRPDAQLAANVLRFLGFVQSGETARWLGEEGVRGLEAARRGLADRLGAAARELLSTVDDTGAVWRVLTVPLAVGTDLGFFRLLIRDRRDQRDSAVPAHEEPVRFVVDLSLSRLGRVQLDAMVRGAGGRALDLVVRSESPLSVPMQDEIRQVFRGAVEALGLVGQVGFRAVPPGFVLPADWGSAAAGPGIVV
ncbi:MAG: hypothetical protein EA406_11500 [Rhodospirillales bacterium]|nr:MAG: hypothetical protein EA406_11500 [Rhodospirillales bacterium]